MRQPYRITFADRANKTRAYLAEDDAQALAIALGLVRAAIVRARGAGVRWRLDLVEGLSITSQPRRRIDA